MSLHFTIERRLVREHYARDFLNQTAQLGASIHRLGSSQEFKWTLPVKNPKRLDRVLTRLRLDFPHETFSLIDVVSYRDGLEWRPVDLRDELAKLEGFEHE